MPVIRRATAWVIAAVLSASCLAVSAYADDGDLERYDDTNVQYSDDTSDDGTESKARRDEHGQVSWLNTESNNPYHNLIALKIDVGAEFATYDGDGDSEGYIVKCRPGDSVNLPVVRAKDGHTFVGWSQGGVPDEIDWDVFTDNVKMTDDPDGGHQTSIYAVYINDAGDGYCTCGAFKRGIYADRVDEFKQAYSAYLADHRGDRAAVDVLPWLAGLFAVAVALAAGYGFGRRRGTASDEVAEATAEDVAAEGESDPVADRMEVNRDRSDRGGAWT